MLKSKKGKKGDEFEEYPLMSTANVEEATVEPVTTSSSVPAELLITSKADKKTRKRSKAISGM